MEVVSDKSNRHTQYSSMSCSKQQVVELIRGAWSKEEDEILINCVKLHGAAKWRKIANISGLKRCGKSCRLRWLNYLRPDIKRGDITADEEDLIIRLHKLLGNRWSLIAGRLPGRTDNEIKNYWNTKLTKKLNKTYSSMTSNHNKITIKSEKDTQKPQEEDDLDDKMAINNPDLLPDSPKQSGGELLETNDKNGMIFLSSENNVDFLADIGEIECSFSLVDPVVCSSAHAQGSIIWEDNDDMKLLNVEMMMKYNNGDEDLTLLDIELKKLASFLDLDD